MKMSIIETQAEFDLATEQGFKPVYAELAGFAEAIFDQNRLLDLVSNHAIDYDKTSADNWGLDRAAYIKAVKDAIQHSMFIFNDANS
jgi:hypothetical protein